MKTDVQLKLDVTEELRWEPTVTSGDINVTAKDGIVTLSGTVPHYIEKSAAERASRRVEGVRAIAEEMEVHLVGAHQRKDSDIAQAVLHSLTWHVWVPSHVQATVEDGRVTLTGSVKWEYERRAAAEAVSGLSGVTKVCNNLVLEPRDQATAVKDVIDQALKRNAELNAERIHVAADGGKVTLTGTVCTWDERDQARSAAWSAPGVTEVENNLAVLN